MNMKEREWEEEAERIYQEAEADPMAVGILPPSDMRERLLSGVRKLEEEKAREKLSKEDKELLYLGKLYKKRRKQKKYFVLAAALVMAMAIGITSVGGTEKIFEVFKIKCLDREQVQINSDEGTEVVDFVNEEEVYEKIEKEFGFYPVKLNYLPEGTEFQEATIYDETQGIYIVYGKQDRADIVYMIRPNYREGSLGRDVEDELFEEYEVNLRDVTVFVKKYLIKNGSIRWIIQFEYEDVSYFGSVVDIGENEIEKIIKNLIFK